MRTATIGYAASDGFEASADGTVQVTGPGKILGIEAGYAADFPGNIRPLLGNLEGVLVAQQTAANLHVTLGDTVTIHRPGLPDVSVTIDGVVDLPNADSMFQAVGAPSGAQPQAPPDNVLILPLEQWHALFDPQGSVYFQQFRVTLEGDLDLDAFRQAWADVAARHASQSGAVRRSCQTIALCTAWPLARSHSTAVSR